MRTFPIPCSPPVGTSGAGGTRSAPCWTDTQTVFFVFFLPLMLLGMIPVVLLYPSCLYRLVFIQRGLYEAVLLPSLPLYDYPPLISPT